MTISAAHFLVSLAVGILVGCSFTYLAYFAVRRWKRSQQTDHAAAKLTGFEQVIPGPLPPEAVDLEAAIDDVEDAQAKDNSQIQQEDLKSPPQVPDENARYWTTELEAAIRAEDLARLDTALTEARKLQNCSRALLEQGERILCELRLKVELEAALREAIQKKSLQALQQNIHAAQAVQGFSTQLLEDAMRVLEELQQQQRADALLQRSQELETALRAATIEGDLETLEKLLDEASQHGGVNEEVLQKAQLQLERLRAKAKLEKEIRDAMDSGDLDRLLKLLDQSLHDPVSFDVIQQAEAVVETLQRRRELEIDLESAIADYDVDEIRRLMVSAQRAGISQLLIQKAQRVLAEYDEVESQLRGSIAERNLASLQNTIHLVQAKKKFLSLLKDARASEVLLLEEAMDVELEAAMKAGDYHVLCQTVIRAEALKLDSPTFTAARVRLSERYKRQIMEVGWNVGDEAKPWSESSCSHDLNPTVEISIQGDTPGIHEVQCFLEDMDCMDGAAAQSAASGDRKHGFVLIANPQGESSCPTLLPGGPVLASAACNEQGIASSKLELSLGTKIFLGSGETVAKKVFAVASLQGPVVHGGRARFHFWSAVDLSVKLLPRLHERWAHQKNLGGQWLQAEGSAGGPINDEASWLSNPQFQVSLEEEHGPLHFAVALRVRACTCKAYLHVVRGEGSHSDLSPRSIEILAQGTHKSFQDLQEITAYIEITDSSGPCFLVPSLQEHGKGASFELEVMSNSKLQVQQVQADQAHPKRSSRVSEPEDLHVEPGLSVGAEELRKSLKSAPGEMPAIDDDRLERIKAIFTRQDSDFTGTLDRQEFESYIRKLAENHGVSLDEGDVEAMFEECDESQDGKVDLIEFVNWAIASGLGV